MRIGEIKMKTEHKDKLLKSARNMLSITHWIVDKFQGIGWCEFCDAENDNEHDDDCEYDLFMQSTDYLR